jgi:hypothetical protein
MPTKYKLESLKRGQHFGDGTTILKKPLRFGCVWRIFEWLIIWSSGGLL